MNEFFRQLVDDARRLWEQMSGAQRMLVAGISVAAVVLLVGLTVWAQQPAYVTLYTKLSDKDAGEIIAKLKDRNVPYQINGGAIEVPSAQVHETRLALAGEGLPAGGTVGFQELFNGTGSWTATDFERKLNYQRGLEGELSRTIEAIDGVEKARVHIVIPKESLFVEDEQATTASVLLTMDALTKLEIPQVRTIQHLVAKAVPRLAQDQVFVTDTNGRDYTEEMAKLDPKNLAGTDLSNRQLELKKKYERDLERRIQAQLDTVLGQENSVVRVNTVWDFSQFETNAEMYAPSIPGGTGGIMLSEKGKNEQYNGQMAGDGGTPGVVSNNDPSYQGTTANGQNGTYTNNEYTRNYNTNKEVQRRIKEPALLRDTTISVAYNPRPRPQAVPQAQYDARLQQERRDLANMIARSAGIADVDNKVVVTAMAFNMTAQRAEAAADEAARYQAWLFRMLTLAAAVLVALIALILFLGSFRRRRQDEIQEIEEALPRLPADDLGITLIDEEIGGDELTALPMASPDEQRLSDMQRELANFIKQNPKDAVKLVRTWVNEDE